tara:strand:+ start:98 stop:328 length:231 start_codon:yes stop_codon:yes gene_type:complete
MIQPIRCFTCGKVVADQIDYYNREKEKLIKEKKIDETVDDNHFYKTYTKDLLDNLGATRYCCRRMFITDVDLMNVI